jgi:hypothetical protein
MTCRAYKQNVLDDELPEPQQVVPIREHCHSQITIFGTHEQLPGDIKGVLFGDTLAVVCVGHLRLFLGKLHVAHTTVVHIMDEGRPYNGHQEERIGRETMRILMKRLLVAFLDVGLDNAMEELVHRHSDVASVLEIVKGVRRPSVGGCDDRNKLAELVDDPILEHNTTIVDSFHQTRGLGVVLGHGQTFLDFIETRVAGLLIVYETRGGSRLIQKETLTTRDNHAQAIRKKFNAPLHQTILFDNHCLIGLHCMAQSFGRLGHFGRSRDGVSRHFSTVVSGGEPVGFKDSFAFHSHRIFPERQPVRLSPFLQLGCG